MRWLFVLLPHLPFQMCNKRPNHKIKMAILNTLSPHAVGIPLARVFPLFCTPNFLLLTISLLLVSCFPEHYCIWRTQPTLTLTNPVRHSRCSSASGACGRISHKPERRRWRGLRRRMGGTCCRRGIERPERGVRESVAVAACRFERRGDDSDAFPTPPEVASGKWWNFHGYGVLVGTEL